LEKVIFIKENGGGQYAGFLPGRPGRPLGDDGIHRAGGVVCGVRDMGKGEDEGRGSRRLSIADEMGRV